MKKIFVDCSYLSTHQELNTGIQRVVRKIIENLELLIGEKKEFKIILVNISNGEFFKLSKKNIEHKVLTKFDINIEKVGKALERQGILKREKLTISKDDILLLLDSTWYDNIWPTVKSVKLNGAKVVAVIYDLIPITNPEFCDDFLAKVFKRWFEESLNYVDGYICISKTVEEDLISFLYKNFPNRAKEKDYDYFLLGNDFNYKDLNKFIIRDKLNNILKQDTYLIVSTIEPRKNHKYLLDVFDILWSKSININLLIMGRVGWKVEDIINRIQNHKLLNKNLFYFTDINDKELQHCYEKSKMLLFPSVIEGFGLPIIEALSNNLPVLASDIPIHREVGKNNIGYFDILNVNSLVEKIVDIETNSIPNNLIVKKFKWLSWKDSAEMLLKKVKMIEKKEIDISSIENIINEVKSKIDKNSDKFPIKPIYEYNDFLKYNDKEFIIYIYKALLQREIDETTLNYRVNQLRDGKKSKLELISIVRASKEGRINHIKLLGFYKRFFMTTMFSIFPILAQNHRRFDSLENKLYLSTKDSADNLKKYLKQNIENISYTLEDNIDILKDKLEDKSNIEDTQNLYKQFLSQRDIIKEYLNKLERVIDNDDIEIIKELKVDIKESSFELLYSQFEDKFRGDENEIKSRLSLYIPFLHSIKKDSKEIDILDIGCGRGEWLAILKENSYSAKGIDSNQNMVHISKKRGLNAEKIDALSYLKQQPNNSLSLITGFHIIEHLDSFDTLLELLMESHRVLKSGGFIIFETPNPRNILVGASDFYIDPSHKTPIHPMALKFFVQKIGFENVSSLIINDKELIDIDEIKFTSIDDYIYIGRDYFTIGYKI